MNTKYTTEMILTAKSRLRDKGVLTRKDELVLNRANNALLVGQPIKPSDATRLGFLLIWTSVV